MINDTGNPVLGGFGMSNLFNGMIHSGKADAPKVDSLRWLAPELLGTDSRSNDSETDSDDEGKGEKGIESDREESQRDNDSDSDSQSDKADSGPIGMFSTQSDIFSLARTILEVMTGEQPFKNVTSSLDIIAKVKKGDRPKRPKRNSVAVKRGLDDELWQLLTQCWAQEPKERPDISKVNEELERIWPDVKLS